MPVEVSNVGAVQVSVRAVVVPPTAAADDGAITAIHVAVVLIVGCRELYPVHQNIARTVLVEGVPASPLYLLRWIA